MQIQANQLQEIQKLLTEYVQFNEKLSKIQEEIERLDLERTQMFEELKVLHTREEVLYTQLAQENNLSIEEVKNELINSIIAK